MFRTLILRKFAIAGCIIVASSLVACSTDSGSNQSVGNSPMEQPNSQPLSPVDAVGDPLVLIRPYVTKDLSQYSEFRYQSASTVGLSPDASVTADAILAGLVEPYVAEATDDNEKIDCLDIGIQCGYFALALEWLPCDDSILCVKQSLDQTPIGGATGSSQVNTVRLSVETGSAVGLSEYLGVDGVESFLKALNASSELIQRENDLYDPDDPPDYQVDTVPAWLPLSDGIHIWYPKYSVASGALEIIEIRLKESSSGWNSWYVEPNYRSPILDADSTVDNTPIEGPSYPGVFEAPQALLQQIVLDARLSNEPEWCFTVNLSNRDPRWGILNESKKAIRNPDQCTLSDAFSFVGLVNGRWELLDSAGSYVDYCSGFREGLKGEGVTNKAISDFLTTFDCMPDEEVFGETSGVEGDPQNSDSTPNSSQDNGRQRFLSVVRPIFDSGKYFPGTNFTDDSLLLMGGLNCQYFSSNGYTDDARLSLVRGFFWPTSYESPGVARDAKLIVSASERFLCPPSSSDPSLLNGYIKPS